MRVSTCGRCCLVGGMSGWRTWWPRRWTCRCLIAVVRVRARVQSAGRSAHVRGLCPQGTSLGQVIVMCDNALSTCPPVSTPTWTFRLPWTSPPLSLNSRQHWAAKARITSSVRRSTAWLCKPLGAANQIQVTLTYVPKDSRRRDADNLVATLKPICDGIVDAGVVTDDDPLHMIKDMPVIAAADPKDPRLELTITVLDPITNRKTHTETHSNTNGYGTSHQSISQNGSHKTRQQGTR